MATHNEKVIWALLCLPFLIVPAFWFADLIPWLLPYDEKRVASSILLLTISLLIAISAPVANETAITINQLPKYIKLSIFIVFALATATALQTKYPLIALRDVALYGLLLAVSLFISAVYQILRGWFVNGLILTLIILASVYSFTCLVDYIFELMGGHVAEEKRRAINFVNVRFFNQLQAWTFPLLIFGILAGDMPRIIHRVAFAGAVGWVVLALFSKSAGIAIAVLVAPAAIIILTGWTNLQNCRSYFSYYALTIVAGVTVHSLLFIALPKFLGVEQNVRSITVGNISLAGRDELWQSAWGWFRESPWIGNGPTNLVAFYNNPHNALLQWLTEWGSISTLLVTFALGWGLIRWFLFLREKSLNPLSIKQNNLMLGLSISAISASILAMVSGVIVTPFSQVFIALTIGLMLGIYQQEHDKKLKMPIALPYGIRFITLVLVAFYLKMTLPEVLDRYRTPDGLMAGYLARYEQGERLSPRFWQHGPFPHMKTSMPRCLDYETHTLDWLCYARLEIERERRERPSSIDSEIN